MSEEMGCSSRLDLPKTLDSWTLDSWTLDSWTLDSCYFRHGGGVKYVISIFFNIDKRFLISLVYFLETECNKTISVLREGSIFAKRTFANKRLCTLASFCLL